MASVGGWVDWMSVARCDTGAEEKFTGCGGCHAGSRARRQFEQLGQRQVGVKGQKADQNTRTEAVDVDGGQKVGRKAGPQTQKDPN